MCYQQNAAFKNINLTLFYMSINAPKLIYSNFKTYFTQKVYFVGRFHLMGQISWNKNKSEIVVFALFCEHTSKEEFPVEWICYRRNRWFLLFSRIKFIDIGHALFKKQKRIQQSICIFIVHTCENSTWNIWTFKTSK